MLSWVQLQLLRSSLHTTPTAPRLIRRGVTKLTVTVVVIMFELTGALTYILPTMVSPAMSRGDRHA